MIPKYYITTQDELVRVAATLPNFLHNWCSLEGGHVLVRVSERGLVVPDSWEPIGHVMDHKAVVTNAHCMKLRQHGVLPTDSPFHAIMRVAESHPDMEP